MVQNLKQYIVRRNVRTLTPHLSVGAATLNLLVLQVNCIVVLQNATISNITKPLAFLLEDIASCVRYCNLHGGR